MRLKTTAINHSDVKETAGRYEHLSTVGGPFWRGPKGMIALVAVLLLAVGGFYMVFGRMTPEERAAKELAKAIEAAGKLMLLPEGDEPVLATVTDAEALKAQQTFFAEAVNGDQLLLFPRNLKAVVYSPSRNKIVNAGPIEQQPAAAAPQTNADKTQTVAEDSPRSSASGLRASATVIETLTVEVRNGTGKNGLAAEAAESLRAAGFEVIAVADAKNKKYTNTVLMSRTSDGAKSELAASLAAQIGAEFVTELPDGEKSTGADTLIILGGE